MVDPSPAPECVLMGEEEETGSWGSVIAAKESGVMAVASAVGLLANIFAVCLMIASKNHLRLTTRYLMNRAVADMLFLMTVPLDAQTHLHDSWLYGSVVCKLRSTLALMTPLVSSSFLVAVCGSWYLDACKPHMDAKTRSTLLKVVSVVCWSFFFIFSLPTFLQSQVFVEVSQERLHCVSLPLSEDSILSQALRLLVIFLVLVMPLTLSGVFLSLILPDCRYQTAPAAPPAPQPSDSEPSTPSLTEPPHRLLVALVVVFAVCQLPYWLVYLVRELLRGVQFSEGAMMLFPATMCLPALNAALNPLVCVYFLKDLRKGVSKVRKVHDKPQMIALVSL